MNDAALIRILRNIAPFSLWPEGVLARAAPRCSVYTAEGGETLFLKGEPLEGLWLPLEGSWLYGGTPVKVLEPLDLWALRENRRAEGGLKTQTPGLVLFFSRWDFQALAGQYPSVITDGGFPPHLQTALWKDWKRHRRAQGFIPLEPGERVIRFIRPSRIHLAAAGIGAILLSFFLPALLFHFLAPAAGAVSAAAAAVVLISLGLLSSAWFPLRYLKELFLLTDRALILSRYHYRGFRREILRIPLEEVQLFRWGIPGAASRLLGLCYLEVSSAAGPAEGEMSFCISALARGDNPEEDYRRAAEEWRQCQAGRRRMRLREMVQGRGASGSEAGVPGSGGPAEEESGGGGSTDAVYRKSRWVLLRAAAFPLVFLAGGAVGAAVYPVPPAAFLALGIGAAALAVLLWRWEDWRNDRFYVQGDRLVDWDALPFGLRERKSVMPLAEIQTVRAEQRGIWRNLLGVGNVVIRGSAGGEPLIFEDVASPWLVLRDIFLRRRERALQEEDRRRRERQQEWVELMGVYGELKETDNKERWQL